MLSKIVNILLVICVITFFSDLANAQQDTPYFTNKDIEKYKSPSDNKALKTKIDAKKKTEKTNTQKEMEYWCKRATEQKEEINGIQEDIRETEKRLFELQEGTIVDQSKKKALRQLNNKLYNLKKHLKDKEKKLNDFEDEAHRKNIPPGWLRCQFDW